MPTRRTVRVAEVLRKELAACMSQSLDLEGLLITISSIDLPPDMKQAFVYVSTLHPDLEQARALLDSGTEVLLPSDPLALGPDEVRSVRHFQRDGPRPGGSPGGTES